MKLKALFLTALLSLTLLLSACAENQTPQTTEPTLQSSNETDSSEFDFDDAMKNIYIEGKKISLPCTLKDLGEGFTLDGLGMTVNDEKTKFLYSIYKDGVFTSCTAVVTDCTAENFNEGTIISLDAIGLSTVICDFGIYDLRIYQEITKEEIINIFGDEIYISENGTYYEYKVNDSKYISFTLTDGILKSFSIKVK